MESDKIVCTAYPVKYGNIEYYDNYVVITQNRTRRRVSKGYYFEDTGRYIYVSSFYAGCFQHKMKCKRFELNTETKEWEEYEKIVIEKHIPIKEELKDDNVVADLKK